MLRLLFFTAIILNSATLPAQTVDTFAIYSIKKFQHALNDEYKNPHESPLDSISRSRFVQHNFYPIDLSYRVTARLIRTPKEAVFKMKTTGPRTPEYVKYGELHFVLNEKPCKLSVYKNIQLSKRDEYKDYLFLPFTDNTNGDETYGGGRYIDLREPEGKTMILDFNQSYNPFCAYSDKYSCPIPPAENHVDQFIRAGIQYNAAKH